MQKRFLIIVSLTGSLFSETTAPERKIDDNAVISERDPRLRIELPASVQYVGADRWILYEIADCELHAFVEADEQKNVQRLYWIQFEGYVPSRPDLHHKKGGKEDTSFIFLEPNNPRLGGQGLKNVCGKFSRERD
jgi:hypothetical protein